MRKIFYIFMKKYLTDNKKLFLILFLAFFLRFIFSYLYPVTLDESWSHFLSFTSVSNIFNELRSDSTSPVFIYIVHKVFNIFHSEAFIRLPFFLSGFISLFFIYKISDNRTFALLFSSFSFFLIKESSIARMHSFSLLFSCASLYFFIKTFGEAKIKNFILFSLFSIFSAYNFYPSLSLTFGLFISYLILSKDSESPFVYYAASFLLIAFISVPAFYFLDIFSIKNRFMTNLSFPSGAFLPYLIHSFSFSEEIFPYKEIKNFKLITFLVFTLPILIIFIKGLLCDMSYKKKIMFISSAVSIFLFFLVSLKIPKVLYSPKYLMALYPAFVYFISEGVSKLKRQYEILLIFFLILSNSYSFYLAFSENKEDWRKIADFVSLNTNGEEEVLVFSQAMQYPFSFYYKKPFIALKEVSQVQNIFKKGIYGVFYIKSHDYENKSVLYQNEIEKKLKLKYYKKFGNIEIFRYDSK